MSGRPGAGAQAQERVDEHVMNTPCPTLLDALQQYADANGKFWKRFLRQAWMAGTGEETDGLLGELKAQFGPQWLMGENNPIKPNYPAGLCALNISKRTTHDNKSRA